MKNKRLHICIGIGIITVFLLLFGFTVFNGVNTLNNISVHVQNIQLEDIGLSSTKLKLTVLFSNPTAHDLSYLSGVFSIYIADTYVGNGSFPYFSLYANSQKSEVVSLTLYYANLANAVLEGLRQGEFDLTFKGEIQTRILFDLLTIKHSFSSSATFP